VVEHQAGGGGQIGIAGTAQRPGDVIRALALAVENSDVGLAYSFDNDGLTSFVGVGGEAGKIHV